MSVYTINYLSYFPYACIIEDRRLFISTTGDTYDRKNITDNKTYESILDSKHRTYIAIKSIPEIDFPLPAEEGRMRAKAS